MKLSTMSAFGYSSTGERKTAARLLERGMFGTTKVLKLLQKKLR
jgi:hypothetical protein